MRELSEQSHYEVLELARDCARDEVEHAYATLSRAYAKESLAGLPLFDAGELADLRRRITEAFRVLSDAELRRAYDEKLLAVPRAAAPALPARPAPPAPVPVEACDLDGPGLRRLRRARGLELADIESITKIRLRHLHNLEEERFVVLHTFYEKIVELGIRVYEEWLAFSLVIDNDRVHGLVAMEMSTGRLETFAAKVVVLATGGYGRVFSRSSNALINTGSGIAIAYEAGVPIEDMEFVQFHPTTLYGTNILISEGARGEGGYLINNHGERFMEKYGPKAMELAPRDIVSRSIQTEILQGRGFYDEYVHLDLRHLGRAEIMERLPGIREIAMDFAGIDPIETPIPVQPGQHYSMGGVDTDVNGATRVKGLYAAGESACVSVHGAIRLGGNCLLDTSVFGKLVAEAIPRYLESGGAEPRPAVLMAEHKRQEERIKEITSRTHARETVGTILSVMRETMFIKCGIFREKKLIEEALATIRELKERYQKVGINDTAALRYNPGLMNTLELKGMLEISELIVAGALAQAIFAISLTLWQAEQRPLPYGLFQISQTIMNVALSLYFVIGLGYNLCHSGVVRV